MSSSLGKIINVFASIDIVREKFPEKILKLLSEALNCEKKHLKLCTSECISEGAKSCIESLKSELTELLFQELGLFGNFRSNAAAEKDKKTKRASYPLGHDSRSSKYQEQSRSKSWAGSHHPLNSARSKDHHYDQICSPKFRNFKRPHSYWQHCGRTEANRSQGSSHTATAAVSCFKRPPAKESEESARKCIAIQELTKPEDDPEGSDTSSSQRKNVEDLDVIQMEPIASIKAGNNPDRCLKEEPQNGEAEADPLSCNPPEPMEISTNDDQLIRNAPVVDPSEVPPEIHEESPQMSIENDSDLILNQEIQGVPTSNIKIEWEPIEYVEDPIDKEMQRLHGYDNESNKPSLVDDSEVNEILQKFARISGTDELVSLRDITQTFWETQNLQVKEGQYLCSALV